MTSPTPTTTGGKVRQRRHRAPWDRALRIAAALLVVAAVAHVFQASWYERRLNAAVQEVSLRDDLTMNCRMVWEEALDFNGKPGHVRWGSTEAQLRIDVCHNAAMWAGNPTSSRHRQALLVVTHELAHLVGHHNEAETDCVAMWAAPDLAVALGGTREEGEAAARWYASEINPRLPGEYRSPGCLAGDRPESPLLR